MPADAVIGWDIGGAHLKGARIDAGGQLTGVVQLPCPLWRGLEHLETAFAQALAELGPARCHAVTMTGELADIFPDRSTGVRILVDCASRRLAGSLRIYAGALGLVEAGAAASLAARIASANWLASAQFVAGRCADGVLIDIGSTTTDIVPLAGGEPRPRGSSDYERMRLGELIYTGVVRTPLPVLARQVPFEGEWRPLAAEVFATAADVYRLLGRLDARFDMAETADGAGRGERECAVRLARGLGRDPGPEGMRPWRDLARHLAGEQRHGIRRELERVLSCGEVGEHAPLIGAGCGRFLVHELAVQVGRPYLDFAELAQAPPGLGACAAVCAPAVAVAQLAQVG